jgi:transposase
MNALLPISGSGKTHPSTVVWTIGSFASSRNGGKDPLWPGVLLQKVIQPAVLKAGNPQEDQLAYLPAHLLNHTVRQRRERKGCSRAIASCQQKRLRATEVTPFIAVEVASTEAASADTEDVRDRDPASPWLECDRGATLRCKSSASFAGGSGDGIVIGLPSLQALDGAPGPRIWLAAEATDMRCGFDRLAQRVQAVIRADPLSGHLFLFRSRSGNRLKILTWDRDGYVLWYKRLEVGVFKLPRVAPGADSVELRASELAMLLDGIDMAKLKRVPRYERPAQSAVKRAETIVA